MYVNISNLDQYIIIYLIFIVLPLLLNDHLFLLNFIFLY